MPSENRILKWETVLPIVISVVSLLFSYTRTPLYTRSTPKLSWWYTEAFDPAAGTSELRVVVKNDTEEPVRDVLLRVHPVSLRPEITATVNYKIKPGPDATKLITLERVPPNQQVEAVLVEFADEALIKPAVCVSEEGCTGYRCVSWYCGSVKNVQTEYGEAPCQFDRCVEASCERYALCQVNREGFEFASALCPSRPSN